MIECCSAHLHCFTGSVSVEVDDWNCYYHDPSDNGGTCACSRGQLDLLIRNQKEVGCVASRNMAPRLTQAARLGGGSRVPCSLHGSILLVGLEDSDLNPLKDCWTALNVVHFGNCGGYWIHQNDILM